MTVTWKAKTRTAAAVPGDLKADVRVSGAGLDPVAGLALRSLRVAGTVSGSTIAVDQGGVGAVAVGLFMDSRLTAGYSGPDDGSGTFHHPSTVGSFAVKAKAGAFARSHVIAAALKAVTVASVDPGAGGGPFGFVYRDRLGRLAVAAPAFRFDPAGPAVQGLAGSGFQVKRA